MGIFTSGISTIVDNIFTNAKGYNATLRTDMKAFQEASIVSLVNPVEPFEELDQSVKDALDATQWGDAVGDAATDIADCCEQVINLAKNYYSAAGIPGSKMAVLQCSIAAGTFDLVIDRELFNNIGAISGNAHPAAGAFQLTFPAGSFPDLNKVVFSCPHTGNENTDPAAQVSGDALSDQIIQIQTFKTTVAAAPGDAVLAIADNVIAIGTKAILVIQVLP